MAHIMDKCPETGKPVIAASMALLAKIKIGT
jgi:hypothetical protein